MHSCSASHEHNEGRKKGMRDVFLLTIAFILAISICCMDHFVIICTSMSAINQIVPKQITSANKMIRQNLPSRFGANRRDKAP